ncbi:MAG: glycerol kinase GlpK [Thalassobaculales bacterium]
MTGILAIDQGTTSTRAILFAADGAIRAVAQRELPQSFPAEGWVEHDPERIWADTVAVCREALARADAVPAAIGITNQRETVVVWERATGRPIHPAIVWQDRRTAAATAALREAGHEAMVSARTGLLLDPYFSATKIAWILDHVPGARAAAAEGLLACGTIDSFLLWRLTGGRVHATDASNASRTSLFDIARQQWDEELCALFGVPPGMLPEVLDCAGQFGRCEPGVFGQAVPITGIAGDQQAATIGQACFAEGEVKSTYGTGCFAVLNTGGRLVQSRHKLLSTVAWRLGGHTTYALEGSIFVAGAAVQWLRDGLRLFRSAAETAGLAAAARPSGVYLVPAFTGLGAPYWDPHARGAILGLTRDTGIAEIVRATLDAVCWQTRDLMQAMAADAGAPVARLKVDGGMVANDWLLQRLADLVGVPVERPAVIETTALGAAYLAGIGAGLYGGLAEVAGHWRLDRRCEPALPAAEREAGYRGWAAAVARVRSAH